jgi:hypothetical protein
VSSKLGYPSCCLDMLGISGTPRFVIGKTAKDEIAGVRIVGAVPFAIFDSTIKDMLSSKLGRAQEIHNQETGQTRPSPLNAGEVVTSQLQIGTTKAVFQEAW